MIVEIWDIINQRAVTIRTVPAQNSPGGQVETPWLTASNNEQKLAVFAADGTVSIWDVASGQILTTCKGKVSYSSTRFPPIPAIKWYNHDQDLLFSLDGLDGETPLDAWNTNTGAQLFSLNSSSNKLYMEASISPNNNYLALFIGSQKSFPGYAASQPETLEILDAYTGQVLRSYPLGLNNTTASFSWLPDSQRLLMEYAPESSTGSSTPIYPPLRVSTWNVFTDQQTFIASPPYGGPDLTTPDQRYLIMSSDNGHSFDIWQTNTGRKVATVETSGISIHSFYTSNDQYMLIGAQDHFDIWSATTGELLYKYDGLTPYSAYNQTAGNVFWSPDGHYLIMIAGQSASIGEGMAMIWRMP